MPKMRCELAQATKAAALCILFALTTLSACAPLLTGSTDPQASLAILKEQNARGCVYVRASAQPWAQATTIIVGTWGIDPPKYADCWKGLPAGMP